MSEYDCHVCGKEFGSGKAVDSHIGQVHPETLPWNDEEYIYEEYIVKQRTRGEIASELGCSKATITNACERFGFTIDREERQSTYPKLTQPGWLREQYSDHSAPTIAEKVGCTTHAVYCALDRHSIDVDNRHKGAPSGKDNARWKGGHEQNRGYTWPEQREKRLERDGYECVVCGMDNKEHKEQYGQELHVHHIQKIRNFKTENGIDYVEANKLDNLVTLCHSHHSKWEGIPLRPQ